MHSAPSLESFPPYKVGAIRLCQVPGAHVPARVVRQPGDGAAPRQPLVAHLSRRVRAAEPPQPRHPHHPAGRVHSHPDPALGRPCSAAGGPSPAPHPQGVRGQLALLLQRATAHARLHHPIQAGRPLPRTRRFWERDVRRRRVQVGLFKQSYCHFVV